MEQVIAMETNETTNMMSQSQSSDLTLSVDVEGSHIVFGEILPTLQNFASFRVALSLWHDYILFEEKSSNISEIELNASMCNEHFKEVEKSLDYLPVPNVIKDIIKKYLVEIREETIWWMEDHKPILFDIKISYLSSFVWRSNTMLNFGSIIIDYRRTAQKMFSMFNLSEVEKFKILSKCCCEAEITSLSLDDPSLERFMKTTNFQEDRFVYYWICVLNNELDKIPLNTGFSLDRFMISQIRIDNELITEYERQFAYTYFWNRMSEREQILEAIEAVKDFYRFRFVLSKLNESQQRYVFLKIPEEIIMRSFRDCLDPDLAFSVWMRVENLITCEQFLTMVMDTLFDYQCINLKALEEIWDSCVPTMIKLWITASDQLKSYLLNEEKDTIRACFFEPGRDFINLPYSMEFLSTVLSHSPDFAKDMMLRHGDNLVTEVHFSKVDKIIQICRLNANEAAQFKRLLTKSAVVKKYCTCLIEKHDIDYLDKFLEFYFREDEEIRKIKSELNISKLE